MGQIPSLLDVHWPTAAWNSKMDPLQTMEAGDWALGSLLILSSQTRPLTLQSSQGRLPLILSLSFLNEASPLGRTFHLFVLQVPTLHCNFSFTLTRYSTPPTSHTLEREEMVQPGKRPGKRSQADTQEESERCQESRELSGPVQDHPPPGSPASPSLSATAVPLIPAQPFQ